MHKETAHLAKQRQDGISSNQALYTENIPEASHETGFGLEYPCLFFSSLSNSGKLLLRSEERVMSHINYGLAPRRTRLGRHLSTEDGTRNAG